MVKDICVQVILAKKKTEVYGNKCTGTQISVKGEINAGQSYKGNRRAGCI